MKIGILGSGQLARMLALAGYRMGLRFSCYGPEADPSANDVMPHVRGAWNDETALWSFARDRDIITFETENIPTAAARFLKERGKKLFPDPDALEVTQDRLLEKNFLRTLGIPTAGFTRIDSQKDIETALAGTSARFILKTRRNGYDGKNQYALDSSETIAAAWSHVGEQESILEERVEFHGECSLIAVRNRAGAITCYPLIQNRHRGGILIASRLLHSDLARTFQPKAEAFAKAILERWEYVGVLTLEFFMLGDELIANEMAPRVHNSGHWTLDAAVTSQFENHLRAIVGWPLGETVPSQEFVMFNILDRMPSVSKLAEIGSLKIHDYRKEPAAGRKVGHVTLLKPSEANCRQTMDLVCRQPGCDALLKDFMSWKS